MKTIQPVSVWVNGQVKTATKLQCTISYDDMSSSATFSYSLQQEIAPPEGAPENIPVMNTSVSTGFVAMGGQDYQDWDDSNNAAYEYVADKLNLVIVVPE